MKEVFDTTYYSVLHMHQTKSCISAFQKTFHNLKIYSERGNTGLTAGLTFDNDIIHIH